MKSKHENNNNNDKTCSTTRLSQRVYFCSHVFPNPDRYIFNNNKQLSKLKSRDEIIRRFARLHPLRRELANGQWVAEWLRNPKYFKVEHTPGPPLEACAFDPRLEIGQYFSYIRACFCLLVCLSVFSYLRCMKVNGQPPFGDAKEEILGTYSR